MSEYSSSYASSVEQQINLLYDAHIGAYRL